MLRPCSHPKQLLQLVNKLIGVPTISVPVGRNAGLCLQLDSRPWEACLQLLDALSARLKPVPGSVRCSTCFVTCILIASRERHRQPRRKRRPR
jgi:hypothetical protein